MLRITADVNGMPIGQLYIHNTGKRWREFWYYNAATWDYDRQDGIFGIEDVRHDRSRPWTDLVVAVLKEMPR